HHDHVEAHAHSRQSLAFLQELLSGTHDAPPLPTIDAGGRAAIRLTRARAHFGNHEHIAVARHDVQLAEASAIVAKQNLEPLFLEELGCDALCSCADVLPVGRSCPVSRPWLSHVAISLK